MRREIRAYPSVKVDWVAFSVGFILEENVALISGLSQLVRTCSVYFSFSDGFSAVNGPVALKSTSQVVYTENWVFARIYTSGSGGEAISGWVSITGTAAKLRPPRDCDL